MDVANNCNKLMITTRRAIGWGLLNEGVVCDNASVVFGNIVTNFSRQNDTTVTVATCDLNAGLGQTKND